MQRENSPMTVRLASWGKRASKYGNQRIKAAGVSFDSKSEARRWQELQLLQRAGEIRDLSLHPRFSLDVDGHHICYYVGDYAYEARDPKSPKNWIKVCEDRKAGRVTQTDVFKLKRKLMWAIYRIDILITGEES
jgi:Protein of unknown function (DUF1064)